MDDRIERLAGRGRRMRRDGEHRKAALAYGELTAAEPDCPRWWVLLAAVLGELRRDTEARKALCQAAYLYRRRGDGERVTVVQGLIARVDSGETVITRVRQSGHVWGSRRMGARASLAD